MKKSLILFLYFYATFITPSFSSEGFDLDREFKKAEVDIYKIEIIVKDFQDCFKDFSEKQPISKNIVEAFNILAQKTKKNEGLAKYFDILVKGLCEEKAETIGIFSINALQKKFINPIIEKALNKSEKITWGGCFKEVCSFNQEDYFEIFKLPYHQLLLKFFFDQGIPHDFIFDQKNLYEAIVSNSRDSLSLSLKLLNKQQYNRNQN